MIVDAVRSPIGKKNGTLSHIRGDELGAQVVNALVTRNGVDPAEIEDVQWGCVTQVDEQAWNIGRNVALTAGWPVSVAGTTVDRQCGSSMQTNFNAAAAVWSGQLDLVVSGGVEMMSRVPMGSNNGSMSPLVWERHDIVMQGISAEEIAKQWNLSREELDRISYESHQRAARAIDEGRFEREVVPIELDVPESDDSGGAPTLTRVRFAVDEAVRRETTLEKMASLQPAFIPDGVVTAGNSSQIVDGSAAVLVASEAKVSELGLEPRARFVSFGVVGVDPHLMLHGNPEASAKALAKAGLTWDEIDVIEVNEAFASVVLAVPRGHGPAGAVRGRRREPERRRHLARPPARRHRRADHGHARLGARAARRALRARDDVHRLRPGHRRRDRAGLARAAHQPPW